MAKFSCCQHLCISFLLILNFFYLKRGQKPSTALANLYLWPLKNDKSIICAQFCKAYAGWEGDARAKCESIERVVLRHLRRGKLQGNLPTQAQNTNTNDKRNIHEHKFFSFFKSIWIEIIIVYSALGMNYIYDHFFVFSCAPPWVSSLNHLL